MIILRSSPTSPFVRKVRLAAAYLGLTDRIDDTPASPADPKTPLLGENPLGKVPALVLEDGTVLFDSPVILEYLDYLAGGGKIIPSEAAARFRALRLQALADGLLEAAVLIGAENRWHDEIHRAPAWIAHQQAKIDRSLDHLEANRPSGPIDVGHISAACALGHIERRYGPTWHAGRAKLFAWLEAFAAKVPAYEETRIVE